MNLKSIWSAFEESYGVCSDASAPAIEKFAEESHLSARNWIFTAEGKRLREEAEALTDTYFFAPWNCLSESELEDLSHLAEQLRDGLQNVKG